MITLIKKSFSETQHVLTQFLAADQNLEKVRLLSEKIVSTIKNGHKVISCGNGGSMCDAMHFAEELTGRFRNDRNALPAIAISDASHITCTGNDYGFDYIFSRYIEGVGQSGDMLLGISTSGNSPNISNAVKAARAQGIYTVALLGKDGGKIREMVDLPIIVPGQTSDRIQEIHIKIIHIAIEATEKILFSS